MKNFNKFLLVLMLGLMTTATVMAQNVILSENFESGVIPTGWTTIDADGDGNVWVSSSTPGIYHFPDVDLTGEGHNGSAHFVISGSYANQGNLVLTPDNYLVTPELNLSGEATLKYWVCAQDANYPADHYGVFASTGGNTASDFTVTLFEETMTAKNAILKNKKQETRNGAKVQGTWYERTVTIPANTKYIAFRHYNCTDQFILNLDDVTITGGGGSSVNTDRYITLTVQQGEDISLDLYADAANTPIKVVSGSSETTLTVGTAWTDFQDYHAGAGTMTVYGNIKGFDCSGNGSKITALNPSHNTALEYLYCSINSLSSLDVSSNTALEVLFCSSNNLSSLDISSNTALTGLGCYGNNFTTQAYDDLMCSLPERAAADNAWFEPLYNASGANYAIFHNANSANAINKNWKVQYYVDDSEIPATAGTFACSSVNTDRYITLTVQQGEQISLDLWADAANTPIKVVSGSSETTLTVGTAWTDFQFYHAGASTMTVYGNIKRFDCSGNGSKITALDASHNTALTFLDCSGNNLSSLDLSHNTALMYLFCYGNNFTTQAYDDLMCSLPERAVADNAWFEPLHNASDVNVAIFHNANSANAINKNWKVQYYEDDSEIPATAGNYDCSNGIDNIAAITATLYPNPVKDLLNIISDSEITGYELYDALGRMLINKTNLSSNEDVINVSSLNQGIYMLKLNTEKGSGIFKVVVE